MFCLDYSISCFFIRKEKGYAMPGPASSSNRYSRRGRFVARTQDGHWSGSSPVLSDLVSCIKAGYPAADIYRAKGNKVVRLISKAGEKTNGEMGIGTTYASPYYSRPRRKTWNPGDSIWEGRQMIKKD